MKKRVKYILYAVFFLIGLSILLYPTISDRWNQYRADQLIASYTMNVVEDDSHKYDEMRKNAEDYNRALVGGEVPDVFAVREGVDDPVYEGNLSMNEDGMMGYIDIPKIDVNLPIYHYTTLEVLEKGCGHIAGSSLPVGGEDTHTVLSAHRGLPSAKMFTDLNLLEVGDTFYLHIMGEILAYEVDQIQVVEPDETRSLAIEKGEDMCTLVTCTPYAVNTQRLLVRGHRIPYIEEEYKEVQEEPKAVDKNMIWAQVLCVVIGILIAVIVVAIRERYVSYKNKKRNNRENG